MASTDPAGRGEAILFYTSLLVLTVVSLWPIWASRFLPMQDYPQHLFLAHVTSTYDDPRFNWKEFYRVDLGFRPYMLWYLAMRLLAGLGVEIAGKIIFSLYILLITVVALAARRLAYKGGKPWGALLMYPLAFSQMYYMGFTNYIISLPLLFLAVLDLDPLAEGMSAWKTARHGLYLLILMLNHPYTILVYIGLAATSAFSHLNDRSPFLRPLVSAGIISIFFATWYLTQHGASSAPTASPWQMWWWPLYAVVRFYLLMFTGMRWHGGPDWWTVSLWCVVGAFFFSAWMRRDKGDPASRRLVWLYIASLEGFFVLPYWMGYYSFFNLRLAPVSYFLLSFLLCRLRLSLRCSAFLGAIVLALLLISIQTQKSLVLETETILPVLSAARGNAMVLPLMYNSSPKAIDSVFFYQLHAHETDYYHLFPGGGVNPTLFPNSMMPVQYQPGIRLPYPDKPDSFSWPEHGEYYDYVLVREAPSALYGYLALTCNLVATSGPWALFQNKTGRKCYPGDDCECRTLQNGRNSEATSSRNQ